VKPYLDKEKIIQSMIDTIGKEQFLLAKFHEGEEIEDSDNYAVYDTTWMHNFDGFEVEIMDDNVLRLRHSDHRDIFLHQPSKDAWIVWK